MTEDFTLKKTESSKTLKNLLEALLFSSPHPLTVQEITKIINASASEIEQLARELQEEYTRREGALIIRSQGKKWQMVVKPEYGITIKEKMKRTSSKTISRSTLETLAIISLYQPVTKVDIDLKRGVNSVQALKTLLEEGLITICGRSNSPGKPFLYRVTEKFFEIFGIEGEEELQKLIHLIKNYHGTAQ